MNHTQQIIQWIKDAGQVPSTRTAALYLGLCAEELAEGLEECLQCTDEIRDRSKMLRSGMCDQFVKRADRTELLDAALDLIWVATGLAYALGADVEGALAEVIRSNDSKRVDGVLVLDDTGKVIKGPNYTKPDLARYL
jgi:predicted HAD superfamily Cof-like phosphohydrolase